MLTCCLLASFLYSHYRKALEIIDDISTDLRTIQTNLDITFDDFERYMQEERTYLLGLKSEPPQETLRFQYVEALQDLSKKKYVISVISC